MKCPSSFEKNRGVLRHLISKTGIPLILNETKQQQHQRMMISTQKYRILLSLLMERTQNVLAVLLHHFDFFGSELRERVELRNKTSCLIHATSTLKMMTSK